MGEPVRNDHHHVQPTNEPGPQGNGRIVVASTAGREWEREMLGQREVGRKGVLDHPIACWQGAKLKKFGGEDFSCRDMETFPFLGLFWLHSVTSIGGTSKSTF